MSCLAAQFLAMRYAGLINSVWPQILTSAFDGRLVLVTTVLAFALRDYHETKPGSLVIALALLCGAFLWGEINAAYIYYPSVRNIPLSLLAVQLQNNATSVAAISSEQSAVNAMAVRDSIMTTVRLLLALPPLALGAGAAFLLKRSLAPVK